MKSSRLKKKIIAVLTAATVTFGGALVLPGSVAEASILEAVLGVGIQYAAISQQISYLDGKGRGELFNSMKQEYGVNNDPELNARLDEIMYNLTAGIGKVDPKIYNKPYNYFINNETTFNAFCSLGHNISVNTGLFDLISNTDEIAVVIAHEMGHGQKNHVVKGFNKTIPVTLGAVVLSEATGGIGGAVLGNVVANQLTAKQITKPQEWEADNLAFEYITNTDYNPGACAAIWQRVYEKMNRDGSNFVGEIFAPSDHPTNIQRRDNYAKKLTEYSHDKVTVKDGVIYLNEKPFLTCTKEEDTDTSAEERAYLVAGQLAKVYNKKERPGTAYIEGDNLYVEEQYILTENPGEPSVHELVAHFDAIR